MYFSADARHSAGLVRFSLFFIGICNILFCAFLFSLCFLEDRYKKWDFDFVSSFLQNFYFFPILCFFDILFSQLHISFHAFITTKCVTSANYAVLWKLPFSLFFYSYLDCSFVGFLYLVFGFWSRCIRCIFLILLDHSCNILLFSVFQNSVRKLISMCAIVMINCATSASYAYLHKCRALHGLLIFAIFYS